MPTRCSRSPTTPPTPAAPPARHSTARALPPRRTALIEDGRLQTFLFDARTARKAGRATTGNASRGSYRSPPAVGTTNLVRRRGKSTLGELLADAGEGLYVTDVAGLHSGVNPVSGTFSVGATGRLIEGGELAARCARSPSPATSSRC